MFTVSPLDNGNRPPANLLDRVPESDLGASRGIETSVPALAWRLASFEPRVEGPTEWLRPSLELTYGVTIQQLIPCVRYQALEGMRECISCAGKPEGDELA